jgi:hypothetical protein
MSDVNRFTLDIQRFVNKTKNNLDLVVRRVAFDIFSRVIEKSPVDTGRFRANWQVAIGSIPGGILEAFDKSGVDTILRVQATVMNAKAGDVIYLVNNVHYSVRLEFGWSKQAPAGMVRTTLQEFGAVVQDAVNQVNS